MNRRESRDIPSSLRPIFDVPTTFLAMTSRAESHEEVGLMKSNRRANSLQATLRVAGTALVLENDGAPSLSNWPVELYALERTRADDRSF